MNVTQAKELKHTILWEEFCKEVDLRIAYYMNRLQTCTPEELISNQKQIEAFKQVKTIPQDVIDREEGPES